MGPEDTGPIEGPEPTFTRTGRRLAWSAVVAYIACVAVILVAVEWGREPRGVTGIGFWLLPLPGMVAFALLCRVAARHHRAQRHVWMLVGGGVCLAFAAHVVRAACVGAGRGVASGELVYAVAYLCALMSFLAALLLRLRWVTPRTFWMQILDATSVSVLLWVCAGIVVADEVAAQWSVETGNHVFQPLIIMWLFAGVISLLLTPMPARWKRTETVLAVSLVFATIEVWSELWLYLRTGTALHAWTMFLLVATWTFGALAPLYETARARPVIRSEDYDRVTWPYLTLGAMPVIALWSVWKGSLATQVVSISGLVVVFVVAVIRQLAVLRAQERSIAEELELTETETRNAEMARSLVAAASDLARASSRDAAEDIAVVAATRVRGVSHAAVGAVEDGDAASARFGFPIPREEGSATRVFIADLDETAPPAEGTLEGIAGQLGVTEDRIALVSRIAEEERRYRDVVDNLPSGVVEASSDGRITGCNRAFATMCGRSVEALAGARVRDVVEFRHPTRAEVVRALSADRDVEGEARLVSPAGRVRIVEFSVRRLLAPTDPERPGARHGPWLLVARDVSERRERRHRVVRLFQEIRAKDRAKAELFDSIMASAEEERRRLAAEIHDGPVQTLTALGLRLDVIAGHLQAASPGPEYATDLGAVRSELTAILEETRDIVSGLGPEALHGAGLVQAMRLLCRKTSSRAGLDVNLDVGRLHGIPDTVEAMLYRILQEALTNAARHAHATRVDVFVGRRGRDVVLDVADDGGSGLDLSAVDLRHLVDEGHYGIAFMQERVRVVGGTLQVGPAPRGGTRVSVTIPDVVEAAP
ncbi:MAG: PAS domain S-box protein [Acidimicrobiia bacterium]|nr:PAS domain S-box protein [Acidimicrobiia bacterium]